MTVMNISIRKTNRLVLALLAGAFLLGGVERVALAIEKPCGPGPGPGGVVLALGKGPKGPGPGPGPGPGGVTDARA
jgi:hypothetical protein